jgi:hypothetical protein
VTAPRDKESRTDDSEAIAASLVEPARFAELFDRHDPAILRWPGPTWTTPGSPTRWPYRPVPVRSRLHRARQRLRRQPGWTALEELDNVQPIPPGRIDPP